MQKVIAANWKMHKTPQETSLFISDFNKLIPNFKCEIILCVPFVDICGAVSAVRSTDVKISAQNCHHEDSGAFTGEISARMLKDSGVEYVILGHSERRTLFGETDEIINKKVLKALKHGLGVILCVGETLEQREQGVEKQTVANQIKKALIGVAPENVNKIIIAYEPVWAIGTGKTVLPVQADDMCKSIRELISDIYAADAARQLKVLYGGSMNSKNAKEILAEKNVDGGLIGGASLDVAEFAKIVEIANEFS